MEIRHEDPTNNTAWRDLVVNNREIVDISGNVDIIGNVDISGNLKYSNVRFFAHGSGSHQVNPGAAIPFNATSINDGGHFDVGVGFHHFEAPINGVYSISISLHVESNNNYYHITPQRATYPNYNYSDYMFFDTLNATSGPSFVFSDSYQSNASINFICKLNSRDRIRVTPRVSSSGYGHLTQFFMGHSFFCGELISPL